MKSFPWKDKRWRRKTKPLENKLIIIPDNHEGIRPLYITVDMSTEHSGFVFSYWSTFYKLRSYGICVISHEATSMKNWFRSRRFPQLVVQSSKSNSKSVIRAFVCKMFSEGSRKYSDLLTVVFETFLKDRSHEKVNANTKNHFYYDVICHTVEIIMFIIFTQFNT